MILGRVTGTVHASEKNAHLEGAKLLIVRAVDVGGSLKGQPLVSLDRVNAGIGDLVLVNREGSSARFVLDDPQTPVQAVILAVVDDVEMSEG